MSTPCNISPCKDAQISLDNGSIKGFHWQIFIAASGNLTPKSSMEPKAAGTDLQDSMKPLYLPKRYSKEVELKVQPPILALSAGDI